MPGERNRTAEEAKISCKVRNFGILYDTKEMMEYISRMKAFVRQQLSELSS
jgi:hypothetical protein